MRFVQICVSSLFLISTSAFAVSNFNLPWYNHGSSEPATFNSADYKNTVLVLEVYQLRCGPCNSNVPNVAALADAYKNNGKVQVVDLGIDQDDDSYRQWVLRHKPNHPVLKDTGRKLSQELGVSSTPTTYILDCNRNVKWQHTGVWTAANVSEIKKTIEDLATQRCTP